MNAAFLLVTMAGFAGADTAPQAAPKAVAPAPVAAAPIVAGNGCGGGCGGCDTCCDDCGGHKLFGKLKGLFHRNKCDTCDSCNTCNECGHGHKFSLHHKSDCGCADTCNSCNECGHKFGGKLKGLFHHKKCDDCGCGGCDSCGSAVIGAPAAAPARVEPIPAPKSGTEPPKKMPEAPKKVQINAPAAPTASLIIEQ